MEHLGVLHFGVQCHKDLVIGYLSFEKYIPVRGSHDIHPGVRSSLREQG